MSLLLVPSDQWKPSEGIRLDDTSLKVVQQPTSAAIVAGPGAGKTELLAQRASFLLQTGVCPEPRRILAISFKRDAAKNLKDRVQTRCGDDLARRFESYTFDAFAKSLLDRFSSALPEWCRPTRDYRIILPRFRDWGEFVDHLEPPPQFDPSDITGQKIEKRHANIGSKPGPVPLLKPIPGSLIEWAVLKWWEQRLTEAPSELTFNMISTLATTVLHHNPQMLKALRQTYAHVFLDEFQDTTTLQYALLTEAFRGSNAVVTAVGDTKQRIMTWAGAAPETFGWLERDFGAVPTALKANFRSNCRIVEIVNAMAKAIEPDAVEVECARRDDPLPEVVDCLIEYSSVDDEAKSLADFISQQTRPRDGVPLCRPDDFLLLVRQKADDVEVCLSSVFAAAGLALRNEARVVGNLSIQDIMTEPLADLIIGVLQLACDDREGAPFQRVRERVGYAFGVDDDRPESHYRLDEAIRVAVTEVRRIVQATKPPQANVEQIVQTILEALDRNLLRRLAADYEQEERMATVEESLTAFLIECSAASPDWRDVITLFTGRGQVRLMTVHKSKGLEAHTVIFLRLQDNAFNPYADMSEEKFMFFVAVSRARERLFVTTTSTIRRRVQPLFDMLDVAGVRPLSNSSS